MKAMNDYHILVDGKRATMFGIPKRVGRDDVYTRPFVKGSFVVPAYVYYNHDGDSYVEFDISVELDDDDPWYKVVIAMVDKSKLPDNPDDLREDIYQSIASLIGHFHELNIVEV